ncbi:putative glycosyl hydrolase [Aspergillus taichungensis]|uniref:Putative glycosyl hydrolase n=1 Tax=Aspergillus taichungensis TaxID=482145 RepID=A0A2J5I815_9EURO|nr:putative glycosyl hydrolase [Aspergillus taichungensis]
MAGMLESKVYEEKEIFFSNNMDKIDVSGFQVPWLYREEITLEKPAKGQHIFLVTHGVTSKADIYLNGEKVVDSKLHQGSYGGHRYDITALVKSGPNAFLVKAYPTSYVRDFAQSFEDWNPYPPDNGTGVWRNMEVQHTGAVSMSPVRVTTDFTKPGTEEVKVSVMTDLVNHEDAPMRGVVQGTIQLDDGSQTVPLSHNFELDSKGKATIKITVPLNKPRIWWPAAWGSQPLYTVNANVSLADGGVSDKLQPTKFGVRHVASELNAHDDTSFTVNGHKFHVRGAGYTPDMFLRFDLERVRTIFQYMLDMGLNTVRLEGKQEHPELYDLADSMGLMVMAGWECCTKWEGWKHNDEGSGDLWTDKDYAIAQAAMEHEAEMMQAHASMLCFLVASDFWPDDRATAMFMDVLDGMNWPNPLIASASKRGFPKQLGPSGMKMEGPYDWVPPNYWYEDQLGAAFGFGSELGSGVGTPELGSLKEFLSEADLSDLWKEPHKDLYHMSKERSKFANRAIYNDALYARYGAPTGLEDYLLKAQIMDYEATRSQFEAYAARQSAEKPASGLIYWMLNGAWPNLHWQLFDYYLRPAGSYFGAKIGSRMEHVAYDYRERTVHIINHGVDKQGSRMVTIDLVDTKGKTIVSKNNTAETAPLSSKQVTAIPEIGKLKDIGFLRLVLKDTTKDTDLSRNVYWVTADNDVLDWDKSTYYVTPVTKYTNMQALSKLSRAEVAAKATPLPDDDKSKLTKVQVMLENNADTPAFFLRLTAVNSVSHKEIAPVYWSDNYVTLLPRERYTVTVEFASDQWEVELSGGNVDKVVIGHS